MHYIMKDMNKALHSHILFLVFAVFMVPSAAFAAGFERDLYYGISNDTEVTRLQEFLKSQSVYSGPVTGNFFSLTRDGVKRFQEREGIAPAAGYFGPKTRGRANEVLSRTSSAPSARLAELESLIASLGSVRTLYPSPSIDALITVYQNELSSLKGGAASPPPAVSPPAPAASLEPSAAPTPPVEAKKEELKVSGGGTNLFPIYVANPTKIGDVTVRNDFSQTIYLSQLIMKISDQMNSPNNRNKKVKFILRNGTTTSDSTVSTEDFTFNSTVPKSDTPHVSLFSMSFPVTFDAGSEKTFSLWVDNFDYVISGSLTIEYSSFLATTNISPVGGFTFLLNRP